MGTILCGIDWASDHNDVALISPEGTGLGRRISHDAAGLGELTTLFAAHGADPGTVKIAIETKRGLLVRPRSHDDVVVAVLGIGEG